MKKLSLTSQETILLYGFLKGVLEKVHSTPDMPLHDKENTTRLLESIMSKVDQQIENITTNN
jgi:hypothetical protein